MQRIEYIPWLFLLFACTLAPAAETPVFHQSFVNKTGEYEVTITVADRGPMVDIVLHNGAEARIAHYLGEALSYRYAKPSPKNDQLFIVWETGSAMYLTVFHLTLAAKHQPVFEGNTEIEPEFVYVGGVNGRNVMLLYSGRQHIGDYWIPKSARVYVWNGDTYKVEEKVRYESRFEALAGLQEKWSH